MVLGGVFMVQCIFPYIEGDAVLNVSTIKIYGKNMRKNERWLVIMFSIYIPSSTAFRVHIRVLCIYSKKEISADMTKK